MEFLYEKVYSNQYFALILFATIAVLLVLFGIVLLAAIKDTKKRKLAELDKLEKENINALQEKKNTLSSDEEVFGVGQAFTEETPKKTLEFFTSEDEQSKTRDIILSEPTTENSMNNLLSQFEDEQKEEVSTNLLDVPINISLSKNVANIEQDHKDIIVPEIEVPIPEIQPVASVAPANLESVTYSSSSSNIETENIIPKKEENVQMQEIISVEEQVAEKPKDILEDNDDDFELPAIKEKEVNNSYSNINLVKPTNTSNVNKSGIDFGKTGIINFSSIESESYDIR